MPKYKKIEPDPVPNCECGVVAFGPKISKTRKNKGREYYCCGVTKSKVDSKKNKDSQKCNFVAWKDEIKK